MADSLYYMQEAIKLAKQGRYTVAPNPMVGCVIVKDSQIIGRGWHERPGGPHAEVNALKEAKDNAQGSIVYVSLEPCSHYGRTPPCVEALIHAKVSEVHFPFIDPNPKVSGQGLSRLKSAGIKVIIGECEAEARKLNEIFLHYIKHKQPFVIAKWAISLDGKMVTQAFDNRQITGLEAQKHLHDIRQALSAILVGSTTALYDNPMLTSRLAHAKNQPLRIILNASGNLPLHLKVFDQSLPGKTLVATTKQAPKIWCEELLKRGVEVLTLPTHNNKIDLLALLDELGRREISSLLVEGGQSVLNSFFSQGLVNQVYAYLAPCIISELPNKLKLAWQNIEQCGEDYFFSASLNKE